ncbi:kielin/chordin-like protein isoform X1 [Physella acuta]|uniref:kielin/chordin-like protein isoform X1 n=1 Tax=Physella acuta TaxID=109671 RepID=UPI0027DCF1C3|nr:kielin/chordin-like protein isoform X1 [Physella acuta]
MMRFLWILCFTLGVVISAPFDPLSDVDKGEGSVSDSMTTPPSPYVTDIWADTAPTDVIETETPPPYVTDFWTTEPQSTPACAEYEMRPDPNDPCKMCFCYSGQEICYMGFCMPAHCVNPQPSGCCMQCPDGPNCQVDDVVIPFGAKVPMDDGRVCSCEYTNGFWSGLSVECEEYLTPEIPTSTAAVTPEFYTDPVPPSTTPGDCIAEENPSLTDACQFCQCTNGQYECVYMDCARPSCPDPVRQPGQCCGVCPDEYLTPEIPTSTAAVTPEFYTDPAPPSTTPGECIAEENPSLTDACQFCQCTNGQYECVYMDCAQPSCPDPVRQPGQCCGVCPDAYTSVLPTDFYTHEVQSTTPAEYFVDPEPTTPAICDDVENESLWNPCVACLCEEGKWSCAEMPCPAVECESAVKEEGQCCGVCPPEKAPKEPPSQPDK